uniref:NADH-ubiquinone oxidoreductase chain 5 n=1 Tax=Odontoglaja guamensis TaxID=259595 RepID=E6Y1A8_9GAST|nr:NADH dehydrogenase subunit 5 [Odontoglaja guamensis]
MKKSLQIPLILFMLFNVSFLLWMVMGMDSYSFILELSLFSISSLDFSFSLILDKISISFAMMIMIISGSVFTFAHKYMEEDVYLNRFLWILLLFVLSMNILLFSGSFLMLMLGWDGLGISSFALIIYYQSNDSLQAGFLTLMTNRLGDALLVVSMLLFTMTHQYSIFSLTNYFSDIGLIFLMALAASTKSAQYPFSSWLPAAMAAPTPVSALVHSSTLVTAGIFLMIRMGNSITLETQTKTLFLFMGAVTCLLGGWAASYENDLKKIIALSTLSQLGVMVFSLGLGLTNLALFHLYTHALFKALLFLAAGNILMSTYGTQDIRLMGGVGMSMPYTIVVFNISNFCLVGSPFLSAFYSKHLILEMSVGYSANLFSFLVMMVATMFTSYYVFRSFKCISWWKPNMSMMSKANSFYNTLPITILAVGAIASGKIISSMELSNLEIISISGFFSSFINILGITGALAGLVATGVKKNMILSSMFFLTPSMSSKPLFFIKNLKELEQGWIEPMYSFSVYKSASVLSSVFMWPNKQVMVSLLMVFIVMHFYL